MLRFSVPNLGKVGQRLGSPKPAWLLPLPNIPNVPNLLLHVCVRMHAGADVRTHAYTSVILCWEG
jgi:hypothetical protein